VASRNSAVSTRLPQMPANGFNVSMIDREENFQSLNAKAIVVCILLIPDQDQADTCLIHPLYNSFQLFFNPEKFP
jgi:predicted metal-dependent peptidase